MKSILLALSLAAFSLAQSPFPTTLDSNGTLGVAADNVSSALTAQILITDTTAQVANATRIPQWAIITFGSEQMKVCAKSGNTLTLGTPAACPSIAGRGLSGTMIAAHSTGVIGHLNIDSYHQQAAATAIMAIEASVPKMVSDASYLASGQTFYQACTAAANAGLTLAVSSRWTSVASGTCGAVVETHTGGIIQPAAGQMVRLKWSSPTYDQICDTSLGGNCAIETPNFEVPLTAWGMKANQNSAAAMQAALNSTAGTQTIKLTLPNAGAQCYLLEAPVTYVGNAYAAQLTIEGATTGAPGGSCLRYTGTAGGTVLTLQGGANTHIKNIIIDANFLAAVGLHIDSLALNGNGYIGKAQDIYEDVVVSSYTSAGIRVGHDCGGGSNRLDSLTFRHVTINGLVPVTPGLRGFDWLCGGNTEEFAMYDSTIQNNDIGMSVLNANSVVLIKPYFFGQTTTDIRTSSGQFYMTGAHSEGSARLLDNSGFSGAIHNDIHIIDSTFGGNGPLYPLDGIIVNSNGPITMEGNYIGAPTTTVTSCTNTNPMTCTFPPSSGGGLYLGDWAVNAVGIINFTGTSLATAVPNGGQAGSGYSVGDIVGVPGGTSGSLRVASATGGGAVLTLTINAAGSGYLPALGVLTTGGSGSGLAVNVTTTIVGAWSPILGNVSAKATAANTLAFYTDPTLTTGVDSSGFGAFAGAGQVTAAIVPKVASFSPRFPSLSQASIYSRGNWYANADTTTGGSPFWQGTSVNTATGGLATLSDSIPSILRNPGVNTVSFTSTGDNGGPLFSSVNLPEYSPGMVGIETSFGAGSFAPGAACTYNSKAFVATSTGNAAGIPYLYVCANNIWVRADMINAPPGAGNPQWVSDGMNIFSGATVAGGGPDVCIGRATGAGCSNGWLFEIDKTGGGPGFTVDNTGLATATAGIVSAGTVQANTGYKYGSTAGFTGTKGVGGCTFVIQGGIVTDVTGC